MNLIQPYYCTGKCTDRHDHTGKWVKITNARSQVLDEFRELILNQVVPFTQEVIDQYNLNLDLIEYCEFDSVDKPI
jgi:hypothetical protein